MMAFFDSLVQREVEGWTSNTDLSDDLENDAGQGSGQDDNDRETSILPSLSVIISQSDDNDSDDDGNCFFSRVRVCLNHSGIFNINREVTNIFYDSILGRKRSIVLIIAFLL